MNKPKKRRTMIYSVAALLFIAPLIVFAVLYESKLRQNNFKPAEADIHVQEGNDHAEELIKPNGFKWKQSGTDYTVDKPVQIFDVRKKNDEYLRVSLVPMWYDADGNVCGGDNAFSDYSTIELDRTDQTQATALLFKNSDNDVLLTLKLCTDPRWSDTWEYNATDHCFYYRGAIRSGDLSTELLSGAQIPGSVFTQTEDYKLHITVLADAIQTSADAKDDRW